MILVSLVGQQAVANLLPIRHLGPRLSLLVETKDMRAVAARLSKLAPAGTETVRVEVPPYDIGGAARAIQSALDAQLQDGEPVVFNLTGGTKTMALGAFILVTRLGGEAVYCQTQGDHPILHRYTCSAGGGFEEGQPSNIAEQLTLEDYWLAHIDEPWSQMPDAIGHESVGWFFEQAIRQALAPPAVDEVVANVSYRGGQMQIDMLVRVANLVAVVEAKAAAPSRKGIDQLNTLAGPEYLGTYTKKILIHDGRWRPEQELSKLATDRNITLIGLSSFDEQRPKHGISGADADMLRQTIRELLGAQS